LGAAIPDDPWGWYPSHSSSLSSPVLIPSHMPVERGPLLIEHRNLIVARRQRSDVLRRCVVRGPSRTVLFLASEGRTSPVAFHVHLEDRRVMYESIDRGEGHGGILKDFPPFPEGLIRRDQNRAPFIPGTDEFEQHGGFRLVLGHIHQIVQNQQMVTIQTLDGRLKCELATGELKLLHQIRG